MRLLLLPVVLPFALFSFLAPRAATASSSSHAADALLADIYQISSLLTSLGRQLTPLAITPAPPASTIQAIRSSLQQTTAQISTSSRSAAAAPPFDDAASAAIANAIADLKDAAFAALDAFESRRMVFDATSAGALSFVSARRFVRADLVALREATTAFGGNLMEKMVKGVRIAAPLVVGDLHWHFTRVVDVMS
ncbi:uncharacterized protein IWZ02DRAFT_493956 [Phyllosticta citriasiana]|uniref:Cell wall protein n=1 Tax=Phyllosticta citriasiana TaxID=595635 RepID=A0ABR1L089_9PEZI